MKLLVSALILLLAIGASPVAADAFLGASTATVIKVESLDQITVSISNHNVLIKLVGLKPSKQCFKKQSNELLRGLVKPGDLIIVTASKVDNLAVSGFISINSNNGKLSDLATILIRSGAVYFSDEDRSYPNKSSYVMAQRHAQAERRGLWANCESPLAAFEDVAKESGVHALTLLGLAMNETRYKGRAWPWTINVKGYGYYYNDRLEAYAAAKSFLARGYRSIDIGQMQVNWKYHSARFSSLWDAFDPLTNQRVAATILRENFEATGSVRKAVSWYHNRSSQDRGRIYLSNFDSNVRAAVNGKFGRINIGDDS